MGREARTYQEALNALSAKMLAGFLDAFRADICPQRG
jgi:hypothetical protein